MSQETDKPLDRIVIDVYAETFELAHTSGLTLFDVATLLYLSLEHIEKQFSDLQEQPTMLQ